MTDLNPIPQDIEQITAHGEQSGVGWANLVVPMWTAALRRFASLDVFATFAALIHAHDTADDIDTIVDARRHSAGVNLGAAATMPLNTTRRTDGTKFSMATTGELVFLAAGAVDIEYSVSGQSTSAGSYTVMLVWLEHYNGSVWAEVTGTRTSVSVPRVSAYEWTLAGRLVGFPVAVNNGFRIRAGKTGSSTIQTFANRINLQAILYNS